MALTEEQLELRAAAAAAALAIQCPNLKKPIPCTNCSELWDFVKAYEHYLDLVKKNLDKDF